MAGRVLGGNGNDSILPNPGYGYTGKKYDPVTEQYDYGFRDYAPAMARFTTVDPIRDGANWYAYCNADPVNHIDLWGLYPKNAGEDGRSDNLSDRVKQTALPSPGATDACYFRALQGNAETFTGTNLTQKQIEESIQILIEAGVLNSEYEVLKDEETVINDALRRLGSNATAKVARPGVDDFEEIKVTATGSIRLVARRDNGEPGHWQEGDENGGYVWDPKDGLLGSDRKVFTDDTRYVRIKGK